MVLWLLSLTGCETEDSLGPSGETAPAVVADEVWAVSGGASDLAWDGSGLIAAAELADVVLRWDPETDHEEELGDRLGASPTAVAIGDDGTRYVALTDHGVEGTVGVLEDLRTVRVLATEADGQLFRRPVDLLLDGDALLVADSGAEAIWRVPLDGSGATLAHGGLEALALVHHGGGLVVAAADQVLQEQGGGLEPLAELGVRGLVSLDGTLLGTTSEGVVDVLTDELAVALDAGRPASMVLAEALLYVADDSGGRIWRADLGRGGD